MKLIRRADAIKVLAEVLYEEPPYLNSAEKRMDFARNALKDIPSFEPKYEITADQLAQLLREGWTISGEPKQGEWIYTNDSLRLDDEWACSRCGNISFMKTNFCDRCGAQMKGADDDAD